MQKERSYGAATLAQGAAVCEKRAAMKSMLLFSTVAVLLTGCVMPGVTPPGYTLERELVADLSGTRLRYSDNHGRYNMTLFPGGRYRFVSISQNESVADTTEGRWSYQRTGPQTGELNVGGEVWYLEFTSSSAARASTPGDVRTYFFAFERLDQTM
jgi:hypothetical protein